MNSEIRRTGRELMYQGAILEVYKDHMEFANGNTEDWDFIHHNGAAAVVPVLDDGCLLMVSQYRNALERDTLEIPAGKLDAADEKGRECAKRELEEETGYRSRKWIYLGKTVESPAKLTNYMYIYLAEECEKVSDQKLDYGEDIDVLEVEFDDAIGMIMSNQIICSSSIGAILKVERMKRT